MEEMTSMVADVWRVRGGALHETTEHNLVWLNLDRAEMSEGHFAEIGRKYQVWLDGGRVILTSHIIAEAIRRLGKVFDGVLSKISTQVIS